MNRTMSLSVALLLAGASALAPAQGYPNKPVRIPLNLTAYLKHSRNPASALTP